MPTTYDINNAPPTGYQEGGWYWDPAAKQARQFSGGKFGDPNVINNPNQVGYGQQVSPEVQAQSNPTMTAATNPTVAVNNGVTATQQPALDVQSLYDKSMTSPEIKSVSDQIAELDKQINDKETKYNAVVAAENDNPWLAEATRVGRIGKINDKKNAEMNTLVARKQVLADQLASYKADAQNKLNVALKQYDINKQGTQDNLNKLSVLISTGAIGNLSDADLATLGGATGFTTEQLKAVKTRSKTKDANLQIVKGDNGSYAVVDMNNNGKEVSKGQIGDGGDSKTGANSVGGKIGSVLESNKNTYGHVGSQLWNEALGQWQTQNQGTPEDFIKKYGMYTDYNLDPESFFKAYGFSKAKRKELFGK
jgi:hypothetical protein